MRWSSEAWNNAYPMNIGVQAELSDVRSNATGHCYLELIQKDPRSNNLIAKARGNIWNNVYRLLKPYFEEATGQLCHIGYQSADQSNRSVPRTIWL